MSHKVRGKWLLKQILKLIFYTLESCDFEVWHIVSCLGCIWIFVSQSTWNTLDHKTAVCPELATARSGPWTTVISQLMILPDPNCHMSKKKMVLCAADCFYLKTTGVIKPPNKILIMEVIPYQKRIYIQPRLWAFMGQVLFFLLHTLLLDWYPYVLLQK